MKIHTVAYVFSQSQLHYLYLGSVMPITKHTNLWVAVASFLHKSSDMEHYKQRRYMSFYICTCPLTDKIYE